MVQVRCGLGYVTYVTEQENGNFTAPALGVSEQELRHQFQEHKCRYIRRRAEIRKKNETYR